MEWDSDSSSRVGGRGSREESGGGVGEGEDGVTVDGSSRLLERMIQRSLGLCRELLRASDPSTSRKESSSSREEDRAERDQGGVEAEEDGWGHYSCEGACWLPRTQHAQHCGACRARGIGELAIGLARMAFGADGQYRGGMSWARTRPHRGDRGEALGANAVSANAVSSPNPPPPPPPSPSSPDSDVGESVAADRRWGGRGGSVTSGQGLVQATQERARVDTALRTLLQDLGRVLVKTRGGTCDRRRDAAESFPATAAQVLDSMVWIRAAAPFALLDAVAASLTQPPSLTPPPPSIHTLTSLLSSFSHFDHVDVRLLAAAVAAAHRPEPAVGRAVDTREIACSAPSDTAGGVRGCGGEGLACLAAPELLQLAEAVTKIARSEGHMPVLHSHVKCDM